MSIIVATYLTTYLTASEWPHNLPLNLHHQKDIKIFVHICQTLQEFLWLGHGNMTVKPYVLSVRAIRFDNGIWVSDYGFS